MINPLFFFSRALLHLNTKIRLFFWQWYHVNYCLANNVLLNNNVKFNGKSRISVNPQSICTIGEGFILNSGPDAGVVDSTPSKITVCKGAKLEIGDYTGLSSVVIYCGESITIGRHVNIGGGTMINDSNHHSTDWRDRADRKRDVQNAKSAPIVIGDYVFIGARCMINKGVTIGEKSIIAAGSVVVKDIPANCIAGGNPCTVIKMMNE